MKQKYDVTGMTCSACSAHVEKSVRHIDGVHQVNVNLLQNVMTVEYDEDIVDDTAIMKAVFDGGYGASIRQNANLSGKIGSGNGNQLDSTRLGQKSATELELENMKQRLISSIILLIPLMYLSMGHMLGMPLPGLLSGLKNAISYGMTQLLLVLPVMYVNRKFYQVGFKTLFKGSPNMDSLIAIGSGAAFVYGIFAIYRMGYGLGIQDFELVEKYHMDLYFESVSMILTLITVGKFLEARSKGKTSTAIQKLMDLTPKTAFVERNNMEIEIPYEQLVIGDIIVVRQGGKVPVDGMIVEGHGTFDESSLTGESIPVEKSIGEQVLSATLNKAGFVKFKATKVGEDTTLSQIIHLVEEASGSKAPIAKLADKISGVFVPIVIIIALLSAGIWLLLGYGVEFALSTGIAVLVISCPCALGLATPTAIMVGTGKGAEYGILIKSAESLELAHKVNTVVMDKTGTITTGHPKVSNVVAITVCDEDFVRIAASIEQQSEHPLAEAIVQYAVMLGIKPLSVEAFHATQGEGIEALVNGELIYAGNARMMNDRGINLASVEVKSKKFAEEGKTVLYFARKEQLLGMIAVVDEVKPTSAQAIEAFEQLGMEVVMLTGDNKRTAEAVRKQLGIHRVVAEVLPQDKEKEIRKLQEQGKTVAMIGDGINDAPALTRADVGIAIGAGTDVAIESADIVLIRGDLMDSVSAVQLSRAVIRNIKQNLFWAFFYNSLGIPLAAGIFYPMFGIKLNPMFGAAAMSLSSVFVVSNALRLKLFKPTKLKKSNSILKNNERQGKEMKKTIVIEGMMCGHCQARVNDALNLIDGVTAEVDLENKKANIVLNKEISDQVLVDAITTAGYKVIEIY